MTGSPPGLFVTEPALSILPRDWPIQFAYRYPALA